MPTCSHCGNSLRGEREQIGARCPLCREPLYEEPGDPHRASTTVPAAVEGRCPVHANNPAWGTCQHCGNYFCSVCWSSWRGQSLCSACVAQALEEKEATPAEVRAHFRQALLAMIFGVSAWLLTLLAVILLAVGMADEINPGVMLLGVVALLLSPLPSLLGVGQGAAAVRARGNHMILATMGLILSGLHTGIILGLFTVQVFQD